MYTLDLYQIKNICRDMAELGAASYAKQTEPEKDTLSQREAYRRFGASRVKFWEQKQYIHSYRTGVAENSKRHYSYAELMSVQKAEEMKKYLINTSKSKNKKIKN